MAILSPKQREVWRSPVKRWNVLVGAVRSGKTYIGYLLKAKRMRQLPPGNCLLVGKTERTYCRNVLDPMRELYGDELIGQINGRGMVTLFGRPCYVVGANDERAVQKIQGMGLIYCDGDEFPTWPQSFFQMLKSRLSEPGAMCDLTGNPEGPYHWAKQFIDTTGNLNCWHFTLNDNPYLDPEYVQAIKTEYSGVWYQRLIEGLWVAAEGAIYDMFSEALHVVDDLPEIKAHYIACDYGTANPTVFLLIGHAVDGKYYVVDEWRWDSAEKHRQLTDEQYSQELRAWISAHGIHPVKIIIDPSAASFKAQLRLDRFVGLKDADNTVLDGIRRTAMLLNVERLFIHRRCKGLIKELTSYVWDAKAAERGEDVPVKQNDHAPDALRYFVNEMYGRFGPMRTYN